MSDVLTLSPESTAIDKLAHLVALSETFRDGRTWQQAYEQSIDYFARHTFAGQQRPQRPFAVVDHAGGTVYSLEAGGGFNVLLPSGQVFLYLEIDWSQDHRSLDDYDVRQATHIAGNYFGMVAQEVVANAARDVSEDLGKHFDDGSGDLSILGVQQQFFTFADPDDYQPDDWHFFAGYLVQWGFTQ